MNELSSSNKTFSFLRGLLVREKKQIVLNISLEFELIFNKFSHDIIVKKLHEGA
jgi:hypothetical protein